MDLAQNLIATAYSVEDNFFIDLTPLDEVVFTLKLLGQLCFCRNALQAEVGKRAGESRALEGISLSGTPLYLASGVQAAVNGWPHGGCKSGTGNTRQHLSSETSSADDPSDFCFLENNRLLVVTENLELFSIEDMPQFCWIFFDLDFLEGRAVIPWQYWGPLNSRVFHHHWRYETATIGNRVFQGFPAIDMNMPADDVPDGTEYELHMMDFSPLAVKRCQGVGRVVKEPSTIVLEGQFITTSLPYVGVTLERSSFIAS
ncbi:hypothetical protein K503DRAFT_781772 [Rhizopogon vinicolor AM-OR11-026]|uniref:Uncharacterized protein n=1 Tax=Rhizopogon vinicolor AM-OR11-026 TaxID=1314800 RepID=A0A1B7N539_9AGAM|nr:hypothetical protein K503DRAFT_781772 [Rhizopogon vinicolor AM-OR11-026]